MRNVVLLRIEQRADGWWIVVAGGPPDLIPPAMRERGPLPSQEVAGQWARDWRPALGALLGTRAPFHVLITGFTGKAS